MGMFDKNYEKSSENLYEEIKAYLKPKDGRKHIILINTMSKLTTNGWECDNKYTIQINSIIDNMQSDEYEIVDMKLDEIQYLGNSSLIRTLIVYK